MKHIPTVIRSLVEQPKGTFFIVRKPRMEFTPIYLKLSDAGTDDVLVMPISEVIAYMHTHRNHIRDMQLDKLQEKDYDWFMSNYPKAVCAFKCSTDPFIHIGIVEHVEAVNQITNGFISALFV